MGENANNEKTVWEEKKQGTSQDKIEEWTGEKGG